MTIINTQCLLLSFIPKTRLDEVYPNVLIALRIMLNSPHTVAISTESSFSKLNLIQDFSNGALGPLRGHGAFFLGATSRGLH